MPAFSGAVFVRHDVVGYVALFFAITGVAYAAGPLKSGDPAGGDLSGTYPEPVSAAGDGKDSTDFVPAGTLVTRTFNASNSGLGPHECGTFSNVGVPGGNPGDPVFVSAPYGSGIVVAASPAAGTR